MAETLRRRRWELITLVVLFVGYMGYYVCRSNFSVSVPLLVSDASDRGITKEGIGWVQSWGLLWYAVGKFTTGILSDFVGGRRMYLFGMGASIVCTIALASSRSLTSLAVLWSANRLVQSMGWGSLVKIASNWFSYDRYARVMGWLTLSYLFGDAAARFYLGQLLKGGLGWRALFVLAAATLGAILAASLVLLKSSPRDVGMKEPRTNPENVFGRAGEEHQPTGLFDLLGPFLRSFPFWMVLILSLGLTFIRETFNFWLPTYLVEAVGLSTDEAASWSALFPLAGGFSAIVCGYAADRVARSGKGLVILAGMVGLVLSLLSLAMQRGAASPALTLFMIGMVGFCMTGPYTFLSGAIAMDMGGKRGSSTAAGLADGVGYLASVLTGFGIGEIAERHGWSAAFGVLAALAAVAAIASVAYLFAPRRAIASLADAAQPSP